MSSITTNWNCQRVHLLHSILNWRMLNRPAMPTKKFLKMSTESRPNAVDLRSDTPDQLAKETIYILLFLWKLSDAQTMVAHRLMSSVMHIKNDDDWPVHCLIFAIQDLCGSPSATTTIYCTIPRSMIFGSVPWRQIWSNHGSSPLLTHPS